MSTIGENIKRLRHDAGLSQQQLADKIGTTRSAVSQYESGKIVPKMGVIESMSNALNVTKLAVIGDLPIVQEGQMTYDEKELLRLYGSLSEENRKLLVKVARALSKN